MILLISGDSCTGKTYFAQKCLERYHIPYISMDHIKMGLIRSSLATFKATDSDEKITQKFWPVLEEIAKTNLENKQHLIIEGCYLDSKRAYELKKSYPEVQILILTMTPEYINKHYDDKIIRFRNVIEERLTLEDRNIQQFIEGHQKYTELVRKYNFHHLQFKSDFESEMNEYFRCLDEIMKKEGILYENEKSNSSR